MLNKKVEEALNAQINGQLTYIYLWQHIAMPTATQAWATGSRFNSRRSKTMPR